MLHARVREVLDAQRQLVPPALAERTTDRDVVAEIERRC
jgi:hypothetical protein